MDADIDYGKWKVTVYRTHATPLREVSRIPESTFSGRDNTLFACVIDVDVLGGPFLRVYTRGDNRKLVPTDTLKHFVYARAVEFEGATLEQFVAFVGRSLLRAYPDMTSVRVRGRELPFEPMAGEGVLLGREGDAAVAELRLDRSAHGAVITAHHSGREGLRLVKLTGSTFVDFARDELTTLPQAADRTLYVYLDVRWRYGDPDDAYGEGSGRYVPSEQVRDLLGVTFQRFVSHSIQHLVHEMGQRMLVRFPQLAEVTFEAQNRSWELVSTSSSDPRVRALTEPPGPFGHIGLTLRR